MDCKTALILALIASLSAVVVLAAEEGCPPKMCQTAKFKCISQDSCNGTLFMGGPKCGCCPECVPFRGEGAQCDVEEIPIAASKPAANEKQPLPAPPVKAAEPENLKDKKAPNVCGNGLTCLQGTCVVIF